MLRREGAAGAGEAVGFTGECRSRDIIEAAGVGGGRRMGLRAENDNSGTGGGGGRVGVLPCSQF